MKYWTESWVVVDMTLAGAGGWLRVPVLGVSVTPMRRHGVVAIASSHVAAGVGAVMLNHNLHSSYLFLRDEHFRAAFDDCDYVIVDGFPVWILSKIAAAFGRAPTRDFDRVGSTDWVELLLRSSKVKVNVVAIGGSARSSRECQRFMERSYPDHSWIGFDGFRFESVDPGVGSLDDCLASANIVLVGMGMPLQEYWIQRNRAKLGNAFVASVGGFFDYYSGEQKVAPRWMGRLGLEWIFRFIHSPRRLFHRYFMEPFSLAFILFRRVIGDKWRR